MATNIAPHNLGEVINGALALIENKDIKIPSYPYKSPVPIIYYTNYLVFYKTLV